MCSHHVRVYLLCRKIAKIRHFAMMFGIWTIVHVISNIRVNIINFFCSRRTVNTSMYKKGIVIFPFILKIKNNSTRTHAEKRKKEKKLPTKATRHPKYTQYNGTFVFFFLAHSLAMQSAGKSYLTTTTKDGHTQIYASYRLFFCCFC